MKKCKGKPNDSAETKSRVVCLTNIKVFSLHMFTIFYLFILLLPTDHLFLSKVV